MYMCIFVIYKSSIDPPTDDDPPTHNPLDLSPYTYIHINKYRDERFTVLSAERRPFPNSKMGRDLVKVILLIA